MELTVVFYLFLLVIFSVYCFFNLALLGIRYQKIIPLIPFAILISSVLFFVPFLIIDVMNRNLVSIITMISLIFILGVILND